MRDSWRRFECFTYHFGHLTLTLVACSLARCPYHGTTFPKKKGQLDIFVLIRWCSPFYSISSVQIHRWNNSFCVEVFLTSLYSWMGSDVFCTLFVIYWLTNTMSRSPKVPKGIYWLFWPLMFCLPLFLLCVYVKNSISCKTSLRRLTVCK